MKYNFLNQPKRLIYIGIIKMVFLTSILFLIYEWIINDFLLSLIWHFLLFIVIFVILEPIVLFLGISDIIHGRREIRIEIDDIYIRKYENEKLKIDVTVNELKQIVHIYPETLEWRKIVFCLSNKKKINLTITNKEDFPKMDDFFKFLVYYSRKYNNLIKEKKLKDDVIISC